VTSDSNHNDSPEFLQRLLDAEILLRKEIDTLPSELRDLPTLLSDVRFALDGDRPPADKLTAQLKTTQYPIEETETLLHTLIDSLPIGVTIADADGQIIMTNESGVEILGGRPTGNIRNLKTPYTVHRLSGIQVSSQRMPLFKTMQTGERLTGEEYRIRRADGTERVVLTAAKPVKNSEGEIVSGLMVFQDITEKKQNEDAVQRYADRLHILREMDRAILSAHPLVPIAQLTLPQLSKLLPCVRASILLLDRETETLQEKVIQVGSETLSPPSDTIDVTDAWQTVIGELELGHAYFIENTYTTSRDDPLSTLWSSQAIHAHLYHPIRIRAALIGALCIGLSVPGPLPPNQQEFVSELADQLAVAIRQADLYKAVQRHADELEDRVERRTRALRISEARFRVIFKEAPVGIALLNNENRIVQSNDRLQSMLARSEAALNGTRVYDYVHPEDIDDLVAQNPALLNGRAESGRQECRLVRPAGDELWARITLTPMGDSLDRPDLTMVMVEDITEEREAQLAIVQTEKLALTGRLATSLAHEINNPLQTVIGCLGLAEEARGQNENIDLYLKMASEELKRAANIVTRLRDLNHRSTSDEKERTDVREIIRQILLIAHKQLEERDINVQTDMDTDVPRIHAVPDRLQQVFLNLILNAMDAMPDGGNLKVRTLPLVSSEGVRIIIEDSGIGIHPEDQAHIFEAFQTTKSDGLGLGLFISQSIIEDHGGTIEVSSQPDEGSTFTIKLPA
jgi:PAS domain S-box-containing protein